MTQIVKVLSEGIRPPNEKRIVALLHDDVLPETRQIVINIQAGFDAHDHIAASFEAYWDEGLGANEAWTNETIRDSESELATTFAYIRQHIPALKPLQLKLLGYVQVFGDDPDAFGSQQLDAVYADLKQAFAESAYWRNRLRLFVKRRAFGQGISIANISALFTRIAEGTETAQDKALIWDAAETLIAQATTSALLAKILESV
jgi:hypothetical protein